MWPFRKRSCIVQGHRWKTEERKGYRRSDQWYRVAEYIEQERETCRDCSFSMPWETTHEEGLQGLSLPQKDWKKLREEGFVNA